MIRNKQEVRNRDGQVLIIILIAMVIGITVGLSIAARSVTNVRVSSQTEQSQRAFSAAEAGIEDALRRDDLSTTPFFNETLVGSEAKYAVNVAELGGGTTFKVNEPVEKDDVAQINLKKDSGTEVSELAIYWTDKNKATGSNPTEGIPKASLEITQVYFDGTKYLLKKYAFNPSCGIQADDTTTNNFIQISNPIDAAKFPEVKECNSGGGVVGSGSEATTFSSMVRITILPDPILVRIRPIYKRATIAVQSTLPLGTGTPLPTQAYKVESTGTFGQVTRKIEVVRSASALPPIFDYVLYSGLDIVK